MFWWCSRRLARGVFHRSGGDLLELCVSEPHHCSGSTTPGAAALFSALAVLPLALVAGVFGLCGCWCLGRSRSALERAHTLLPHRHGVTLPCAAPTSRCRRLELERIRHIPMLKFIPFNVASVIFCTSAAWMVALSATAFWSSRTARLDSSMRFSGLHIQRRRTQCDMWATAECCCSPPSRRCWQVLQKVKTGTICQKPKLLESLMLAPMGVVESVHTATQCTLKHTANRNGPWRTKPVPNQPGPDDRLAHSLSPCSPQIQRHGAVVRHQTETAWA